MNDMRIVTYVSQDVIKLSCGFKVSKPRSVSLVILQENRKEKTRSELFYECLWKKVCTKSYRV